jgi:uncharacterized Fe-S cluster-containing radical SAM superfamily protein
VSLTGLKTLWFNTGTLCNITCANCYIESSPRNDRLVYLSPDDMLPFLAELTCAVEIGLTGGEPFANPAIIDLIEQALEGGHSVLVLTNAMRPLLRPRVQAGVSALVRRHGDRLTCRVSLDHWSPALHDAERGEGTFAKTLEGVDWLVGVGVRVTIAGRSVSGETEDEARSAYQVLCDRQGWPIVCADPGQLVLFPEMDARRDVPEITTACWGILAKSPDNMMCASSRMVVRRKGSARAEVLACTLLPYDPQFSLGATLAEATAQPVFLNHPHCAQFCVLGGAACS